MRKKQIKRIESPKEPWAYKAAEATTKTAKTTEKAANAP